jgi:hypothetical protein
MPGVACVLSRAAAIGAAPADAVLTRTIPRNYHGRRPGERYVVFESDRFTNKFHELRAGFGRAGAWRYGRCVADKFAVGKLTVHPAADR